MRRRLLNARKPAYGIQPGRAQCAQPRRDEVPRSNLDARLAS